MVHLDAGNAESLGVVSGVRIDRVFLVEAGRGIEFDDEIFIAQGFGVIWRQNQRLSGGFKGSQRDFGRAFDDFRGRPIQ